MQEVKVVWIIVVAVEVVRRRRILGLLIDWDVKESITSRRAQTFFGSSNWKCEIAI